MAAEKLDLLVLQTLRLQPLHGYGIGQRIEQTSGGVFKVTLGSLYPALQRLERSGLVLAEWKTSENGRRARYYGLTPLGREQLREEKREWQRIAAAIARILKAT